MVGMESKSVRRRAWFAAIMLMKTFTICCDGKDHGQDEMERRPLQPRRCCYLEEPREPCINRSNTVAMNRRMVVGYVHFTVNSSSVAHLSQSPD
jgi:hypothetical protein